MKKLFLLGLICAFALESNAQFNYSFTDDVIPVTGVQYGIVGGGHSASLFNRDDIEAELVQPETMNFTYFGGIERIRWYVPHFGVGQQLLYWNAGAAYTGLESLADGASSLSSTTSLTYAKLPLLFYWKSYSRWSPDRRMRANAYFGPYAAMQIGAQEKFEIANADLDIKNTYTLKSGSYIGVDKEGNEIFNGLADDGLPYKIFDWGFTMGAGVEFRLWRRTVIALTVRSDLGMTEVENKDFQVNHYATGNRYNFFGDVNYKYGLPDYSELNRPETRTFSYGLQLSIRKYIGAK